MKLIEAIMNRFNGMKGNGILPLGEYHFAVAYLGGGSRSGPPRAAQFLGAAF